MNTSQCSGIYVHIPFCDAKCGYCDFYSITDFKHKNRLLDAVKQEIAWYSATTDNQKIFDTLYIGGGTPSVLEIAELKDLISVLTRSFRFHSNSEFTIEINPGTVDRTKLKQIYDTGVHRLSIGIQSFNDAELKLLGRIHSSAQAIETIKIARETGFENINTDLIYALPGQTLQDWEKSLSVICQYLPEHISAYSLIYEEGTPFFKMRERGELTDQAEEAEARFYNFTHKFLADAGYLHYEVSSFARGGSYISRHNYKYWQHIDYLAFGPSAHSFIQNKRWSNIRSVTGYIDMISRGEMPIDQHETLDQKTLMFEHIFLGLRTYQGIDLKTFADQFKSAFDDLFARQISQLTDRGYAVLNENNFKLTDKGMILCDEISVQFQN